MILDLILSVVITAAAIAVVAYLGILANRYLENAREQRIYFDVYVVSNGAISYVGSSKHILLT